MSGKARQERKPQFDKQGHDCTLTAITCALLFGRHELIVQCELSDEIICKIDPLQTLFVTPVNDWLNCLRSLA